METVMGPQDQNPREGEASTFARMLTEQRRQISTLFLSFRAVHHEPEFPLEVESAQATGDMVDIWLIDRTEPTYRRRLRIWGPRDVAFDKESPGSFVIGAADRILWDEEEILPPLSRRALVAT